MEIENDSLQPSKIISLCLAFGEILLGLHISSSLIFQKTDIKAVIII